MILTRWDPGIFVVYEDWIWESSITLRWIGLRKWNLGKSRRLRIWLIRISIAFIIKARSNLLRGIILISLCGVNQGFGFREIDRKGKFYGNDEEIFWGFWVSRSRLRGRFGEIDSRYINSGRFGDSQGFFVVNLTMREWDQYKRNTGCTYLSIFVIEIFPLVLSKVKHFLFLRLDMTQGQLLSNVGEVKNGEGMRKRLKISVPHFDNSALVKTFSKTLLGRCMNPEKQEMRTLISNLLKIWKFEDKVVGTDLGFGKFQFDFEKEEDLEGVLKLQPFHFDYWMLSLARWQSKKSLLYPSEIPFWVRVIGVPGEFKTVSTFESIGGAIGRTVAVDLDHSRVQVVVDAFKELCFETTVDFTGGEFYEGEEVPVSLRYEKLFGYCEVCGSLCHKDDVCPLDAKNGKKSPEKKREGREGNDAWFEGGKHDDRARSYKGVVINGNVNPQNKEREGREHYGKGKGKMVEESDSKWMKVSERGNKRAYTNRGSYKGEGDVSRHRSVRREDIRPRDLKEQGREQQGQRGGRVEVREEGEIMRVEEQVAMVPSQKFQEELANTQADGAGVISDPTDAEQGLVTVQGLVEGQGELDDEDVMDMDEIKAHLLENGIDMDAEDFLENLSEEEVEEVLKGNEEGGKGNEEGSKDREEKEMVPVEEDKGLVGGDGEKKHGLRKRLFKSSSSTVGSTKMRVFNALASPRKRVGTKTGTRQGDNGKQLESKGPSNPKNGTQKP
ncbi:hypothetical protein YC2023_093707 [Brassica napus]